MFEYATLSKMSDTPVDQQPSPLPYSSVYHTPIMVTEVLDGLAIQANSWYVDATVGGGGHSEAILQRGANVIAIDQDAEALDFVRSRLSEYIDSQQLQLLHGNFSELSALLQDLSLPQIEGVLLDLGVSSHQLDEKDRGFSFHSDYLDMRMDQSLPVSAAELLAALPEIDLIRLFKELGEERYAARLAKAIVSRRQQQPITSAADLTAIIVEASPPAYRHGSIHPATRVFQALRMAVNAELDSLDRVLPQAFDILAEGGRLAVISFHSLEDRKVKQFIANQPGLRKLHKKPLQASPAEVESNPRSRSAKLRLAIKEEA